MGVWDSYENRILSKGESRRDESLRRSKRYISDKIKDSLSYQTVTIDDEEQKVAVIDTDNLDTKFIFSMPGENIRDGGLVHWMDYYWLIIERDASNEVYTRAKMLQCNHLLKWITSDGVIHEQWCVVEDGTKLKKNSFLAKRFACKINPLNCWKPLKLYILQRGDEICAGVIVVKTRKNI